MKRLVFFLFGAAAASAWWSSFSIIPHDKNWGPLAVLLCALSIIAIIAVIVTIIIHAAAYWNKSE